MRHFGSRHLVGDRQLTTDFQRLDKWLWCARFASTRGACAMMAESGLVRINRQPTGKPHARVRVGDILTLPLYAGVRVVEVRGLSERRGPAAEARTLYAYVPDMADPLAGAPEQGGASSGQADGDAERLKTCGQA